MWKMRAGIGSQTTVQGVTGCLKGRGKRYAREDRHLLKRKGDEPGV